jgi:hypothetical protein
VGPGLWEKWRLRTTIAQARTFTFPDKAIIYEQNPAAARALLDKGGYRETSARFPSSAGSIAVREDPPILADLAQITERGPITFALFGASANPDRPLAFLHERKSPRGEVRLVALRIVGFTYTRLDGGSIIVRYNALPLEMRDDGPPLASGMGEGSGPDLALLPPSAIVLPDGPAEMGPVRIFAAQPDPNDAAGFLLPYEIHGRQKLIHFRLVDDAQGRGPFVIIVNPPRQSRPSPR